MLTQKFMARFLLKERCLTLSHLRLKAKAYFGTRTLSDASQPPMTFDSSPSESAGSRSLHRLVRQSFSSCE
jgi:hypothetical protein